MNKYKPENIIAKIVFENQYCDRCTNDKYNPLNGQGEPCSIKINLSNMDINDINYPKEMVIINGNGICTKFNNILPKKNKVEKKIIKEDQLKL
jgi:hypothetical protein